MSRGFYILACLFFLGQAACNKVSAPSDASGGGGGGGGGASTQLAPQIMSGDGDQKAVQDFPFNFTPTVNGSGFTFSAVNLPAGFALNATNGRIDACPDKVATYPDIEIIATRDGKEAGRMKISVTVTGDPLRDDQWHLANTGQKAYARDGGVVGEDLRVSVSRCRFGATGDGVKWLVSDDGLELKHEDLSANTAPELSRNYPAGLNVPGDPQPGAGHGTSVAGIIAAIQGNSLGGRGVAPKTKIAGNNFLADKAETGLTRIEQAFLAGVDGANYSYGYSSCDTDVKCEPVIATNPKFGTSFPTVLTTLTDGATKGRSGKGLVYVKSAGNDHKAYIHRDSKNAAANFFFTLPIGGDPLVSSPQVLVVSAFGANGALSSYSSFGPEVWVSGAGGEFSYVSFSSITFPTDSYLFRPAIVTTDVSGSGGFAPSAGHNAFNKGEGGLNTAGKYTSVMNGTSAAAPSVSGVAALLLQANPNLHWEDVHYILARTARLVDAKRGPAEPLPWPSHEPVVVGKNVVDVGFPTPYPWDTQNLYNPEWVTNAAGLKYSTWYGFGAVDSEKALEKAIGYTSPFGPLASTAVASGNLALDIPNDGLAGGVTNKLSVSAGSGKKIFTVVVEATVDSPSKIYEMALFLKSPSGTKIPVLIAPNAFNKPGLTSLAGYVTRVNGFLDEDPNGDWEIQAVDTLLEPGSPSIEGTLSNWKITVWHH